MLPVLRYASDGHDHAVRDAVETLADEFRLSDLEASA
jgi:restriction system protein